jgi:hypothetical protein
LHDLHGARHHQGNPVQVTWRDGRLEDNLGLVKLLEAYVEAGGPIDVTPDGDVVEADRTDPSGPSR